MELNNQETLEQQEESGKSKTYADRLSDSQKVMFRESMSVADYIKEISNSTNSTEQSLSDMTEKMDMINSGGSEIDRFVGIINDISDQINLLSLNASLEAARAGEYNREFTPSTSDRFNNRTYGE